MASLPLSRGSDSTCAYGESAALHGMRRLTIWHPSRVMPTHGFAAVLIAGRAGRAGRSMTSSPLPRGSAELAKHVIPAHGCRWHLLQHVPVLDDLAIVVEA